MGDMGDAVAAGEDVVERTGVVQIRAVQGESPRCVAGHRLQEVGALGIVGVAHAGAHPVALVEQSTDNPAADEAGTAGDGDGAVLGNWSHLEPVFVSVAASIVPSRGRAQPGRRARRLGLATTFIPVGRPL